MAGKKKHVDDGGKQSKTSKASSLKKGGKQEGFIAAAPEHLDRFISLGGGSYVYFLNPTDGKTHHLRVNSEKYVTTLNSVLEGKHGEHVRAEMVRKGFPVPQSLSELMAIADANDQALFDALDRQGGV